MISRHEGRSKQINIKFSLQYPNIQEMRTLSQHEIGGQRYSSLLFIMPAYPRSELEGMIRQWPKVNRDTERSAEHT
jgi:hypothetical protein